MAFSAVAETLGLHVKTFNVTPKGIESKRRIFRWRLAAHRPVHVGCWVDQVFFVFSPQLIGHSPFYINISWSLYSVVGLVLAVAVCFDRRRLRSAERTRLHKAVIVDFEELGGHPGELVDLSLTGAYLAVPWSNQLRSGDLVKRNPAIIAVLMPGVGDVTGEMSWIDSAADLVTAGYWFDSLTPQQTVDIVRLITESPAWVRGDEEQKAQLAAAGWCTLHGAARPTMPWRRSHVRVSSGVTIILHQLAAHQGRASASSGPAPEHAAVVEDIGVGACLLTLRYLLEPWSLVSVQIPDSVVQPEVAEVRWCKRRGRHHEAGLQFDRGQSARRREVAEALNLAQH
jgi:cellulose synthase (UDP-forming)